MSHPMRDTPSVKQPAAQLLHFGQFRCGSAAATRMRSLLSRRTTMRRVLPLKLLLAVLLAACVTVNVYFPAAAAEKAADQIIDQITQPGAAQPQGSTPAPKPQSSTTAPSSQSSVLLAAAGNLLDLLIPAANAQG